MDRKFANRFISKLSKELGLSKRNKLAYLLVTHHDLHSIVGFTFQGSGFVKNNFYCQLFIQSLFIPQESLSPVVLTFSNGERIESLWSEAEFESQEEWIVSKIRQFINDNSTLQKIYRNLASGKSRFAYSSILTLWKELLFESIALSKYTEAEVYAKKIIEYSTTTPHEIETIIQCQATQVLSYLTTKNYQVLFDWLKDAQAKAVVDLKIKSPDK